MFVQYHAETIAAYGFAEGLNIDTLLASGTIHPKDQSARVLTKAWTPVMCWHLAQEYSTNCGRLADVWSR